MIAMAPAPPTPIKTLNQDQARLLLEVCNRAEVSLNVAQWNDLASDMGISNGKAAKERFRYLMKQLSDDSCKAATKKTNSKAHNASKNSMPSKSAGTKRQNSGGNNSKTGSKKLKIAHDQVKQEEKLEEDKAKTDVSRIITYEGLTPDEYRELRKDIQAHDLDGLFASMEQNEEVGFDEQA